MKKKALVHGTPESLKIFFADAMSNDYQIVAILSESLEKISVTRNNKELEVFTSQNLPNFICDVIDAIIITDSDNSAANFFIDKGIELRKLIILSATEGWKRIVKREADGTQVVYFCGLEFHLRNEDDINFFRHIHWWLQNQWRVKNLNPQLYPAILAQDFRRQTGKPLDFNNVQTFTEKLQWLKIYDATPLKSRLADKYLVRRWVAEKIGSQYLIPLLGVWNDFDDIDFDELPEQFVLKCNHGSGMNIIVRDKKSFDVQRAREKINAWLAVDYSTASLELHYTRIDRKIIAEKFMAKSDAPDIDN